MFNLLEEYMEAKKVEFACVGNEKKEYMEAKTVTHLIFWLRLLKAPQI
jgi:hypothetical protein